MNFSTVCKLQCPVCKSNFHHTFDTDQDGFIFNNLTCSVDNEITFLEIKKKE